MDPNTNSGNGVASDHRYSDGDAAPSESANAENYDNISAYDSPPQSPVRRPVELHGDVLKDALDYCDREPIRMPGCVQPFGAVVVVHARTMRVVAASTNLEGLVGVPLASLRGKTFSESFGAQAASVLKKFRASPMLHHLHEQPFKTPCADPRPVAFSMHKQGKHLLVEFENVVTFDSSFDINRNMRQSLERIIATETVDSVARVLSEEMRRLAGYDRIMVYRFDDEYNGQVIAESRNEAVYGSYMGLRFPAADIPRQARQLYLRNWLRCVMDVDAVPSAVVATDNIRGEPNEWPLDMTDLHCRAVSPVHLQYLRNMAVRASMSLSIVHNNKLWGLVACHHTKPISVPIRMRSTFELMAVAFSAHIGRLQETEYQRHCLSSEHTMRRLLAHNPAAKITDLLRFVEANAPDLMGMFRADGIALVAATNLGPLFSVGYLPRVTPGMWYWLEAACGWDGSRIAWTNCLSRCAVDTPDVVGGVLAMPVPNNHYLLAFRRGVVQTANWGGATPETVKMMPMRKASEEVMGPRVSFEMWRVEYRDRSLPWSTIELREAEALMTFLRASCEGTWQPEKVAEAAAVAVKEEVGAGPIYTGAQSASHALSVVEGCLALLRGSATREQSSIKEASDLQGLVEGMLDLSKADADLLTIEAKPFSIHEIAGACLDASPAGIRSSLRWDGGVWAVGDGMVFHRIVASMMRATLDGAKGDAHRVAVAVTTSPCQAPDLPATNNNSRSAVFASSGTHGVSGPLFSAEHMYGGTHVPLSSAKRAADAQASNTSAPAPAAVGVEQRPVVVVKEARGVRVKVTTSCASPTIDSDGVESLFEPFSLSITGEDISLAVARKLAVAMRGQLEGRIASSTDDPASAPEMILEFEVVLPEYEAGDDGSTISGIGRYSDSSRSSFASEHPPPAPKESTGIPSLEHMRLLLLDADPISVHVFRILAANFGVRAIEAVSAGVDAMRVLGIGSPSCGKQADVVFLDPRAPGAHEALAMIASASCVPVVVMVHGGAKPTDLSNWIALGADSCIATPCHFDELRETLVRFRPQVLGERLGSSSAAPAELASAPIPDAADRDDSGEPQQRKKPRTK